MYVLICVLKNTYHAPNKFTDADYDSNNCTAACCVAEQDSTFRGHYTVGGVVSSSPYSTGQAQSKHTGEMMLLITCTAQCDELFMSFSRSATM